jgi:hypothetical protein
MANMVIELIDILDLLSKVMIPVDNPAPSASISTSKCKLR